MKEIMKHDFKEIKTIAYNNIRHRISNYAWDLTSHTIWFTVWGRIENRVKQQIYNEIRHGIYMQIDPDDWG